MPSSLEWASIEPNTSFRLHETPNLGEFRQEPYTRWWQFLVDEAMGLHIDPGRTLYQYGGEFIWHATPSLGLVLVAAPSDSDPTPRPPNPVVERMLKMASGTHADLDGLVRGPATWIGGYDPELNFYLPFTKVRKAALFDLYRVARADLQRRSS